MPAKHYALGQPAHDAEKQGIRFLVESLPDDWTVYSNSFLVERTGVAHELDAVVVAPHGIYVVELKSWRGRIAGNDYDWFIPEAIRSPLGANRKTAQALKQTLKHRDAAAGATWIDHFVFLSHTEDVDLRGGLSRNHVHTRRSIIAALMDAKGYALRAIGGAPAPDENTRRRLHELLTGSDEKQRPPRKIHQWVITDVLDSSERYVEYRAYSELLPDQRRILRVYALNGPNPERARERCTWEAQVLARVGRHESILKADPLIQTEEGFCLPFEDFRGVTLHTWLEHHSAKLIGQDGVDRRLDLWEKIAEAIAFAHDQGVVHRLLRDDAVLLPDVQNPDQLRITGFDLAKQLSSTQTIAWSTLSDERLATAAPELQRHGFSSATPATDQWALGILLAELFNGGRLFKTTDEFLKKGPPSLRALRSGLKAALDDAFQQMVAERPAERLPSVREAIAAVRATRGSGTAKRDEARLDPENIPENTRLNADYEVRRKLGSGGFSTVYEVHHLVTGRRRAIKVAREETQAADVLRDEYEALRELDHPHIVRVSEPSLSIVPDRLTLVMDRVKGVTLTEWLKERRAQPAQQLRQLAESLLSALEYLEEKGVTHKDIKPDNLIVGDNGITLIDFSLAKKGPNELAIGTAAWRDPKLERWDHEADRYAAALCLFELFTGRHPFGGQPPSPGEPPNIRPEDFDSPALRRFFTQALSPSREHRFASARAMKASFSGVEPASAPEPSTPAAEATKPDSDSPDHPLAATNLSSTAEACLRRAGIVTQGDLVRLTDAQLDAISGLGKKKRDEVYALRETLKLRRVQPTKDAPPAAKALEEKLAGDQTPIQVLGLKARVQEALLKAGLVQIGQVAMATRSDLLELEGFGQTTVEQVSAALQEYKDRRPAVEGPQTLEHMLQQAVAGLDPHQVEVLELRYGLHADPLDQSEVAKKLARAQSEISRAETSALERVDRRPIQELLERIEAVLGQAGGVETVNAVVHALTLRWPVDQNLRAEGVITLVQRMHQTRFQYHRAEHDGSSQLLRLPSIPGEALDRFLRQARELARRFPREDAEHTRRLLKSVLPEYELDPISLATRLESDLRCTDSEQLFEAPVPPRTALDFVLGRERLPILLRDALARVERTFGEGVPHLDEASASELLRSSNTWQLRDGHVHFAQLSFSPTKQDRAKSDVPDELREAQRPPEVVARDLLRALVRGYRLVVTPPERHLEIGRSLAKSLNVPFVSFEDAFFTEIEPRFEEVEKGERYAAMRSRLTQAATEVFNRLVETHCRPGHKFVLGDTGVWQVCQALGLPRSLYDRTTERDLGLCILVVPGVYKNGLQTHFNETGGNVFGIPGTVLPIERKVPAE